MCFIYPVNILFVQKLQCRRRGRRRRLLREISWRVFGEVTPCLEPSGTEASAQHAFLASSTVGTG